MATSALLSMVRSDNPAFPIVFGPKGKALLVSVLVLVQAVLQTKTPSTSWVQAIILAITSGSVSLAAHGFRSSPLPSGTAIDHDHSNVIPVVPPAVQSMRSKMNMYVPESGLGRATLIFGSVLCALLCICQLLSGCTPADTAIEKQIANCILSRYATDIVAGQTPVAAAIDTAAYCATTELEVNTTIENAKKDMLARHASAISDAGTDH